MCLTQKHITGKHVWQGKNMLYIGHHHHISTAQHDHITPPTGPPQVHIPSTNASIATQNHETHQKLTLTI